jgi:hypothetical protein
MHYHDYDISFSDDNEICILRDKICILRDNLQSLFISSGDYSEFMELISINTPMDKVLKTLGYSESDWN